MALIDTILRKGHSSYQKYHLTKIAPNINGTSQKRHLTKTASHKNSTSKLILLVFWSTTNTLLIIPTLTIRHKLEKLDFKIPWPWVWILLQISNIPFIKSLNSALGKWPLGIFFARYAIFVRHHFLRVPYLSILGGVSVICCFVRCH